MRALAAPSWAGLTASIALHALVACAVIFYGRSARVEPAMKPPVDVWAGETVEIAGVVEPPGAPTTASPATLPPPAPPIEAAKPPPDPAPRAARAESPSSTPPRAEASRDPAPGPGSQRVQASTDDLAARILAYQPKPRARPAPEPSEPGPASTSGSLGAPVEAGPPRNFARAFTRAIPAATTSDRAWKELPAGPAGELEVTVEIDEEGHVAGRDVGRDPPRHLERLVDQTLLALRGGRFELTGATTGKQRLRISVALSDQPLDDGPLALGFRSPGPGAPGLAYFQLSNGRRVDVTVKLVP